MTPLETLRASLRGVPAAARVGVDDERAKRIAATVAMVDGALERVGSARTPERIANRAPAARRCLERLRAELSCEGAAGWASATQRVLEALGRADAALAEVERAHAEAVARIDRALREAA